MDATRWGFLGLFLVLACLDLGCNSQPAGTVNAATLNGQQCANQVKNDSFLVQWKNQVPPEYAANKIAPDSLITRFTNVDKDYVEHNVLRKHLYDYSLAEHEFYIENVTTAAMTATSTSPSDAWGPADIHVSDAWSVLGKKGDGVIVAVVDSGADIAHPLLQNQIWVNSGEIPNNGIDDDHDGYVDDYNGYNFNANSTDLSDGANHGTHVSGIIAGQSGADGFTGVAPNAIIMPLKFIDATGSGSVGDAIAAMGYAINHGAKVINASWGGTDCSDLLKQEIATVTLHGTVFANAAGNSGQDLNVAPEWPAAFQIPGKITVGAYNSNEILSSFSNYGVLVDLAAPGENILSTVPPATGQPEGQLGMKSGTSMATPFVAGVAALLFSARPTASVSDVVNAINNSVVIGQGFGVRTSGRIDAYQAANYFLNH